MTGKDTVTDKNTTYKYKTRDHIAPPVSACVVTASPDLAEGFSEKLGYEQVEVKRQLGDVIREGSQVYVVDTKVDDINLWPAPLLLDPDARDKSWLFLISNPEDVSFLEETPPDCAFFDRQTGSVGNVVSHIKKRLNPDANRCIERLDYIDTDTERTFIVGLENGRTYALGFDDVPGADTTEVDSWRIDGGRHHFEVTQRSGNVVEVPWDAVLYHCEPQYEYYKGNRHAGADEGRADRIGGRIRELRTQRGLSVTQLAASSGMKRPNLSRIENGKHVPSLETLERVADALGTPVARLLARTD